MNCGRSNDYEKYLYLQVFPLHKDYLHAGRDASSRTKIPGNTAKTIQYMGNLKQTGMM